MVEPYWIDSQHPGLQKQTPGKAARRLGWQVQFDAWPSQMIPNRWVRECAYRFCTQMSRFQQNVYRTAATHPKKRVHGFFQEIDLI